MTPEAQAILDRVMGRNQQEMQEESPMKINDRRRRSQLKEVSPAGIPTDDVENGIDPKEVKQLTLQNISPKFRGWITERVDQTTHQRFEELVQNVQQILGGFGHAMDNIGTVVNNIGLRVESALHGLNKKGVLTDQEMSKAFNEFLAFREELEKVSHLGLKDRFEALQAWNSKIDVKQMDPRYLNFHQALLDPKEALDVAERISIAKVLGLGEEFCRVIEKQFEVSNVPR